MTTIVCVLSGVIVAMVSFKYGMWCQRTGYGRRRCVYQCPHPGCGFSVRSATWSNVWPHAADHLRDDHAGRLP